MRPFGLATLVVKLGAPLALLGRRWALTWASSDWVFHLGIVALMAISFPYPLSFGAFARALGLSTLTAGDRPSAGSGGCPATRALDRGS